MVNACEGCTEKARGQMVSRAERTEWTLAVLQGLHPGGNIDPEKLRINVDHTLYLAQKRHEARGEELPWSELGLAQKMEIVETLTDFWPKEGVDP